MSQIYGQASFEISVAAVKQLPPDTGYEVVFAGRSNAGKSSAINALCNRRGLARTSKTPGRTQLLNFFRLDEQRALVDLPGYGYAKVPEQVKQQWYRLIDGYLANRQALAGLVLIMDVRRPFARFDDQMINWAKVADVPLHVLLSKADKLGKSQRTNTLREVRKELDKTGLVTSAQLFSATQPLGVDELKTLLDNWYEIAAPTDENTP
ncbi:MAG: YihA family ribosome biogenesis GTP-binding protein [Immundisolibacteraceae bacterium]|nr:YihA family ribosome biogenesis GTP-binding protein [Immundisolibacteraceae bacterium]